MQEVTSFESLPQVDAEYESAISAYLTEMERLKVEMDERQTRIEASRADIDAMLTTMLADLKVITT